VRAGRRFREGEFGKAEKLGEDVPNKTFVCG